MELEMELEIVSPSLITSFVSCESYPLKYCGFAAIDSTKNTSEYLNKKMAR